MQKKRLIIIYQNLAKKNLKKSLNNIIKIKIFLNYLSIITNKCFKTIITKIIYKWHSNNIKESLVVLATFYI